MSDASVEVLLDDFEDKGKWVIAGEGADQTHLTTFAEGAPSKMPGVYADGAVGADHRALVLLIRSATEEVEVDLVARPGQSLAIAGRLQVLNLWVRSPHASIQVSATLGSSAHDRRELLLGKVSANGVWQRLVYDATEPMLDAELLALRIRLTEVVKREGEVMILLDDLTARTTV